MSKRGLSDLALTFGPDKSFIPRVETFARKRKITNHRMVKPRSVVIVGDHVCVQKQRFRAVRHGLVEIVRRDGGSGAGIGIQAPRFGIGDRCNAFARESVILDCFVPLTEFAARKFEHLAHGFPTWVRERTTDFVDSPPGGRAMPAT